MTYRIVFNKNSEAFKKYNVFGKKIRFKKMRALVDLEFRDL
jgi:hypothetical protein